MLWGGFLIEKSAELKVKAKRVIGKGKMQVMG